MNITIHRGVDQIGGCITEISTEKARIFIDMGDNLPGYDEAMTQQQKEAFVASLFGDGATSAAVFYTHFHSDHVGLSAYVPHGVQQYIGSIAKMVMEVKIKRIINIPGCEKQPDISLFLTYEIGKAIWIEDIKVTPFLVSHSACDSYMLLIDADGKKTLHTGDFRDHGYIGEGLREFVPKYIGQVDYLITEGTMLSREDECCDESPYKTLASEKELQEVARTIMQKRRYVFALCSSTNIDTLASFHKANPKGRLFVCAGYQAEVLDIFTKSNGKLSDLYKFDKLSVFPKDQLLDEMLEKGFCILVRGSEYSRSKYQRFIELLINKCPKEERLMIYSMWKGYIELGGKHENKAHTAYENRFDPDSFVYLHTSGHASLECLEWLIKTVNPREAIIGIHKEADTSLNSLNLPDELKVKIIPDNKNIECIIIK